MFNNKITGLVLPSGMLRSEQEIMVRVIPSILNVNDIKFFLFFQYEKMNYQKRVYIKRLCLNMHTKLYKTNSIHIIAIYKTNSITAFL